MMNTILNIIERIAIISTMFLVLCTMYECMTDPYMLYGFKYNIVMCVGSGMIVIVVKCMKELLKKLESETTNE